MSPTLFIALYYNSLLLLVLFVVLQQPRQWRTTCGLWTGCIFFIVMVHITFRHLSSFYFGDTTAYAHLYERIRFEDISEGKDVGFYALTYLLSPLKSIRIYFFLVGLLYVCPVYFCFRRRYREMAAIALLLFVCSFSFWGYGVNGLRNGVATSLMIVAFYAPSKIWKIALFAVAVSMHKSALLPIAVYLVMWRYPKPKWCLLLWAACLVLSLGSSSVGEYLTGYSDLLGDNRLDDYLLADDTSYQGVKSGIFRWDFLIYSIVPIVLGYYYIFRRKFNEPFYLTLYCTYVVCNAVWLFTIYAPFNNRFAYLSWFIYPILLSHPLLVRKDLLPGQAGKLRWMVFLNYAFTYFMWIK